MQVTVPSVIILNKNGTKLLERGLLSFVRNFADACTPVKKGDKQECYYISKMAPPVCGEGGLDKKKAECLITALPRLDMLFYRPSDKMKRQYQKTWSDCIDLPKKKRVCKPEEPSYKKRILGRGQGGRKEAKSSCAIDLKKFKAVVENKCPYIDAGNCPPGKRPPSCRQFRAPKDCKKWCCPYPSFSECLKAEVCYEPLRSPHCYCLEVVSGCDMIKAKK